MGLEEQEDQPSSESCRYPVRAADCDHDVESIEKPPQRPATCPQVQRYLPLPPGVVRHKSGVGPYLDARAVEKLREGRAYVSGTYGEVAQRFEPPRNLQHMLGAAVPRRQVLVKPGDLQASRLARPVKQPGIYYRFRR